MTCEPAENFAAQQNKTLGFRTASASAFDTTGRGIRSLVYVQIIDSFCAALGREKIVTWIPNAERLRAAALVAAILVLFLSGALAWGQRGEPAHAGRGDQALTPSAALLSTSPTIYSTPAPRLPTRTAAKSAWPHAEPRQADAGISRRAATTEFPERGNIRQRTAPNAFRPQNGYPPYTTRPAYPGAANGRAGYAGGARPGYTYPAFPPGHLGAWLNQNRNVPFQGQEQLLRNDPSFRRLPSADQQRLMRQLHQVDQLPPQQRERRLERAEAIEHMSPQDRMQALCVQPTIGRPSRRPQGSGQARVSGFARSSHRSTGNSAQLGALSERLHSGGAGHPDQTAARRTVPFPRVNPTSTFLGTRYCVLKKIAFHSVTISGISSCQVLTGLITSKGIRSVA